MLTKKKGDRVPKENIRGNAPRDMTVEGWLKNRDLWDSYPNVFVQTKDFIVDRETQCLCVNKTAYASRNGWVGGSVSLHRIQDGLLKAEYKEKVKFKLDDVINNKHYQIVNMLYKLVKVDNVVKELWDD